MFCNRLSSLGVATCDVARPLASTHTQQIGRHPVCAGAQGLLSAGRGQRAERGSAELWDGAFAAASPVSCSHGMPVTGGGWRHSEGCAGGCHPSEDLVPGMRTVQHWPDLCCHPLTLIPHPLADFWAQSSIFYVLQELAGFETAASSLGCVMRWWGWQLCWREGFNAPSQYLPALY